MKIQRLFALFLLIPAFCAFAQIIDPKTPVKSESEGTIIVAKLVDGDSLFPKVKQIAKKHSVSSGLLLFNIGKLRNFAIGQYNPVSKQYVSQTYNLPWELVSMHGTIAVGTYSVGGLNLDCQATLADSTNATVSGHLIKGIVAVSNQLVILRLKEISLVKAYRPQTGYWELDVLP